jgi:hydrogenase nickel incorporation protein HypA/HybF
MHESSLMAELLEKIEASARQNSAVKVTAVQLTVGALANISPDHLREHFVLAAPGTIAEGADVRIRVSEDPLSSGIVLESLELER